jgi:soluble lytic murein transglycosylase-like protein
MIYFDLVKKYAEEFKVDPLIAQAIIHVESAENTYATRFEPNWKYFHQIDRFCKTVSPPITFDTERVHQQMSWGLMQVMGSVAREHAFSGHLTMLCEPEYGIKYGCKQLARVRRASYTDLDQIAAYNAGSAKKLTNGLYVNQTYVNKVVEKWNLLKNQKQLT